MYRYSFGLILWLCTAVAYAQFDQQLVELDSMTYAQYSHKEWKLLLHTTDSAICNHQDFYILNLRGAIAANALHKNYTEQYYLQRLIKESPYDSLVLPMLYLNYLSIGQYAQALRINKKTQTFASLKTYYPKAPFVNMIHGEYGFKQSTDTSLYKPLHYAQIGVGFRVKTVSIYNAISYLTQTAYYGNMQQYQYYITANIPLKNNWNIVPAFHILHYNVTDNPPYFDTSQLSGNPYVYGIAASKIHKNLMYGLAFYVSNLNYEHQLQLQPSVTWFPLSNQKIALNTTFNYLTEKKEITTSFMITAAPFQKLNFSLAYLNANTRYYTEQNGFLVNNSYDLTKDRALFMVNWNLYHTWTIYSVLLHERKLENTSDQQYENDMGVIGFRKTF